MVVNNMYALTAAQVVDLDALVLKHGYDSVMAIVHRSKRLDDYEKAYLCDYLHSRKLFLREAFKNEAK